MIKMYDAKFEDKGGKKHRKCSVLILDVMLVQSIYLDMYWL